MANKYLELSNGKISQKEATVVSTGVGDAGGLVALDSSGRVDVSVLPVGVGPDVASLVTTDALSAGNYVNIYDDSGTAKCRLADASNGREAHGFVLDAFLNAATATVFFEGPNTELAGLTAGTRYYLNTAGGITATPRTTGLHQYLGTAVNATTVNTDIDDVIVLN